MKSNNLLEVHGLSVVYETSRTVLPVLRDIHLNIERGQVYGLVGESGSGKTTLGLAIMRYLPPEGRLLKGVINLETEDLMQKEISEMRSIWGKDIALVPQNPYSSLNPSIRIGDQMAEAFQAKGMRKKAGRRQALEWIERVRLPGPAQIVRKFPHELSGGQIQRILIAMALSNQPKLLVLDEPTTSLDVTTEAAVLDLLRELIAATGTSVLFITHNLGVVANLTDRVAVLYAGELIEDAPTKLLYRQPLHPYSQGLFNCLPILGAHKDTETIQGISGQIPFPSKLPQGCVFSPRCDYAIDLCVQKRPSLESTKDGRRVRCHRWRKVKDEDMAPSTKIMPSKPWVGASDPPILQVNNLEVSYAVSGSDLVPSLGRKQRIKAVDRVRFQLSKGRTIGIVGESGSGKSSLALALMGLTKTCGGEIIFLHFRLPNDVRKRERGILRQLQMVFQNQDETFSPYLTVQEILSRPLINLNKLPKKAIETRVHELLGMVRLPAEYLGRYPHQLSGGEKQRVAIALAFAAQPELLIADEPVSALDVSVQANILNLINSLQVEHKTASILISHDIAVVSYLADEIAVMYLGQLMQLDDARRLLQPPYHPYTEALLSAVPVPDPGHTSKIIRLVGDIPNPLEKPSGCSFHTRCPRVLGEICRVEAPPWQYGPNGKQIYCHIPLDSLEKIQEAIVFDNGEES